MEGEDVLNGLFQVTKQRYVSSELSKLSQDLEEAGFRAGGTTGRSLKPTSGVLRLNNIADPCWLTAHVASETRPETADVSPVRYSSFPGAH